jgi:lysophospholipase L1-like esterase
MKNGICYVAFGDSLTRGVGASHEDWSFPNLYFKSIKQTDDCRLINLGQSGMSSTELLHFIQEPEIRKVWQQATDITITIGGNDLLRIYNQGGTWLRYMISLYALNNNLKQILQRICTSNSGAHILVMGLYNPGLPKHPLYVRGDSIIKKVNQIYAKIADAHQKVHFIDPYPHFLHKQSLLADDIHPNDKGYKMMSSLFKAKRLRYNMSPV